LIREVYGLPEYLGALHAAWLNESAIYFKRNLLSATFIPHRLLTREVFDKWALDFLTFGNGYLEL
jgi:capsid portal protein